MSKSSRKTFGTLDIDTSNEAVWEKISKMPNQRGTYKEIIDFITRGHTMSAAEGNALSAPIIRALNAGERAGTLDAKEEAISEITGKPNTVYRWLETPGEPMVEGETAREKIERLEAQLEKAAERLQFIQDINDRHVQRLEGLLLRPLTQAERSGR
jgi:hypothetical protein